MFLIRLSICIDFIIIPVTPGLGYSNLHKKSITIGELSGQYYFGQKGQSYCSQRGQSCLAKRVKVAWLFHERHNCRIYPDNRGIYWHFKVADYPAYTLPAEISRAYLNREISIRDVYVHWHRDGRSTI